MQKLGLIPERRIFMERRQINSLSGIDIPSLGFEDIRFADLMKRFEKTYDIRIVIQNKSLHDYKCSGKCRVSDGVDFILQVLQRSTRFTFSRSDDNTIIYIK